jgi:hypothetical protein
MSATTLRWVSEDRRKKALENLTSRVAAWSGRWSLTPAPLDPQLVALEELQASVQPYSGEHGVVVLQVEGGSVSDLGGTLADAPPTGSKGLSQAIGERALDDLLSTLAGKPRTDITPAALLERTGALAIRLNLSDRLRLLVGLHGDLVESYAPSVRKKPAVRLVRGADAARESTVNGRFVLDLGQVPLSDLDGLQLGDVLVGQSALDQPIRFESAGRASPLHFRLTRIAEARAGLVVPEPTVLESPHD